VSISLIMSAILANFDMRLQWNAGGGGFWRERSHSPFGISFASSAALRSHFIASVRDSKRPLNLKSSRRFSSGLSINR
jgi:hypothetical protein